MCVILKRGMQFQGVIQKKKKNEKNIRGLKYYVFCRQRALRMPTNYIISLTFETCTSIYNPNARAFVTTRESIKSLSFIVIR